MGLCGCDQEFTARTRSPKTKGRRTALPQREFVMEALLGEFNDECWMTRSGLGYGDVGVVEAGSRFAG
jgi:hypothetical protein